MSESSTNPFILPGMGQQSGDLSGNPLLASMEMMRQAWAGLAGPGGLVQSLPMGTPANIEELERRIADLRAVEGWLRMNLSMLGSAIQGLEVQRATIATLRSFVGSLSGTDAAPAPGDPSPLEVALGLKPAPGAKAGQGPDKPDTDKPAGSAAPNDAFNAAAQSASQAWWNLLQQQFDQIAAATAATMPGKAPAAAAGEAAPAAPAARKPVRKRAAAKKPVAGKS